MADTPPPSSSSDGPTSTPAPVRAPAPESHPSDDIETPLAAAAEAKAMTFDQAVAEADRQSVISGRVGDSRSGSTVTPTNDVLVDTHIAFHDVEPDAPMSPLREGAQLGEALAGAGAAPLRFPSKDEHLRRPKFLHRFASAPVLDLHDHLSHGPLLEEAKHFGLEEGDDAWLTTRNPHHPDAPPELLSGTPEPGMPKPSFKRRLARFLHSTKVTWGIVFLLVLDAIFVATELALEASETCECELHDGEARREEHEADHALHVAEQALHIGSLVILSIFIVELSLKLYTAPRVCLQSKLEIFDGFIVLSSFVLQLLYGEGASESVGLLVLLRLWRLTRITHGISIAVKVEAGKALTQERKRTMAAQAVAKNLVERLSQYEAVGPQFSLPSFEPPAQPSVTMDEAMDDGAASV